MVLDYALLRIVEGSTYCNEGTHLRIDGKLKGEVQKEAGEDASPKTLAQ
jgi:hypothetical protein